MYTCENCKVNVESDSGTCPLCHEKLGEYNSDESTRLYPMRPKTITQKKFTIFNKLYLFFFIAISLISLVVNLICNKKLSWSLIVISALVYVYVLVRNSILSKSHIAFKLVFQAIVLSLLLFIIEYSIESSPKWALEYAIPFVIFSTILSVSILANVNRLKLKDHIIYMIIITCLGFLPSVFYLTGLIEHYWPSLCLALYSLITLIALYIFSTKTFNTELKKNFHI